MTPTPPLAPFPLVVPPSGLLLVDKPAGVGSSWVTAQVKGWLRTQGLKKPKVGHFGTLDPFATGLLPLGIGEGTKLLAHVPSSPKVYRFTVKWGAETTTGDLTGQITRTSHVQPTFEALTAVLPHFCGQIVQTPPCFSAIWVGGKRAYDLARAGVAFTLPSRTRTIHSLVLENTTAHEATLCVSCEAGTYVRVLGQDIAQALGTLGYLTSLRRLRVGPWDVARSIPLDLLKDFGHTENRWRASLISHLDMLDDIPALTVSEETQRKLRHGQAVPLDIQEAGPILACVAGSVLVALVEVREGSLHPIRVFHEPVGDP